MSHSELTLYELTTERLALQRHLESLDLDVVTIADTLEGNAGALEAKIEDYGWVIRNMESFADAIKTEEMRLAQRRIQTQTKLTHIKEWLKVNMIQSGITKIECPVFSLSIKTNPAAVIIDSEALIPNEFWRVPEPVPTPDKSAIAAAIKSGIEVPGAHLGQSQRLSIK